MLKDFPTKKDSRCWLHKQTKVIWSKENSKFQGKYAIPSKSDVSGIALKHKGAIQSTEEILCKH